MRKITLILGYLMIMGTASWAQKKVLDHSVYDIWHHIENSAISANGETIVYDLVSNGEANPEAVIKNADGKTLLHYARGSMVQLSYDGKYVIFKISPDLHALKEQRRQKVKKDRLPKDSLAIYEVKTARLIKIGGVKDYKVPKRWSGWLAYRLEPEVKTGEKKEDMTKNKKEEDKKQTKIKKENKENGYRLVVRNLSTAEQDTFKYVSEYVLAEKGAGLAFATTGKDDADAGVMVYDFTKGEEKPILTAKGDYKQLAWDEQGSKLAFVADLDTTKVRIRPFELFYWTPELPTAQSIAQQGIDELPSKWLINQYSHLQFAKDGSKLFFGTSPQPVLQDTMLLPEEIVHVEVWSYQDARLHTQQKIEKEKDQKKSYTAVYHIDTKQIVQLGNETIPDISFGNEGNASWVLGSNPNPYMKSISWEGFPIQNDLYLINTITGDRSSIAQKVRGNARFSPNARFIYWYNWSDSVWVTYNIKEKKVYQITNNKQVKYFDERNDSPTYPRPYGVMSWTENDNRVLIYDRYDIWEIDPTAKAAPVNLTKTGRAKRAVYRYVKLDEQERFIKPKQKLVLTVFNEMDKSEEVVTYTYRKGNFVKFLEGNTHFNNLKKARNKNSLIYTQESFAQFPDIRITQLGKSTSKQISYANPQQSEYSWGTIELVHYTSLDGVKLEGLLVKPENFDPHKKYPMMVNFYERSADGLNRHRAPYPHRSTINYAFYASRGYLIFNPDVVYKTGYPGESAYNCVLGGINHLIDQGFVDEENIGLQGHSWGGYQAAYLITRTDIFKCAEAGAPVPDMISAYGGIRWWTGLSRMFQYEHTQSRIGGSLWEYPLRYIDNSPIFFVDKINTPVLIMHNDADGHVPWYQGIEFFVALRRLNKPAWMLNYQGAAHWPRKLQNRKDFVLRMQQYFDYYLQGANMPDWMQHGIPATDVGINQHLELLKK